MPTFGKCDLPKGIHPAEATPVRLHAGQGLPPSKGVTGRRKRTIAISLLVVGVGAAGVYAMTGQRECRDANDPLQAQDRCRSSGGGTSHSFFGRFGSSHSGTSTASVARGGFGATGAAHASGGA